MSKKVKCVSPHGGCRNGRYHNGDPVHPKWDGNGNWVLPDVDPAALRLPPNPGGYIDNARLGTCAVGQVYDAPDDFEADGFHFEDVAGPPAPVKPSPPAPVTTPPGE